MRKIIALLVILITLQTALACTITSFEIPGSANGQPMYAGQPITINLTLEGNCDGNVIITDSNRLKQTEKTVIYETPITGLEMSLSVIPSAPGIRRFQAEFVPNENIQSTGSGGEQLMDGFGFPDDSNSSGDIVVLGFNDTYILNSYRGTNYPKKEEYGDFNIIYAIGSNTSTPLTNVPLTISASGDFNILWTSYGSTETTSYYDFGPYEAEFVTWTISALAENITFTFTGGTGLDTLVETRDVNSAPIINLIAPPNGVYDTVDVNLDYTVTNQNDVNYCELIIGGHVSEIDSTPPFGQFQKSFEYYGDEFIWDVNCITVNGHDYNVNDGVELDSNNGPLTTTVIAFGGDGSITDPYQIDTCGELQSIQNFLDANFVLTTDVNCYYSKLWNTKEGFEPIGQDYDKNGALETTEIFSGTLDGNYYAVHDLNITMPNTNRIGLISYLAPTGIVKRLGLENAQISGSMRVGALVGENYGTVTECYSKGNVRGVYAVGGLVGNNANLVEKSYSDANITAEAYAWGAFAGGLVGWNLSTIINTYATGTINSNEHGTAGLVGTNYQTPGFTAVVENSYSLGKILASEGVGLVDNVIGTVNNSYWDTNTSTKTSGAGTGLFTNEMRKQSTFTGWDFNNIWSIDENNSYPQFIWEK